MDIMHQRCTLFKDMRTHVPLKLWKLFTLGYWSLSCERVMSIRGNARTILSSAMEAKSKAYRLLANVNLRHALPRLLPHMGLVTKESVVAIDFSTFGHFQVLMFAVQTRNGRAIPVYFDIITYPIEKDSQNLFVIRTIEAFVTLVGFRPKLVFDRGFACPSLIKHLAKNKHIFYIRLKGGKRVMGSDGNMCHVRALTSTDARVQAYDLTLRIITSNNPKNGNEPWYLLTNDMRSSRETVIRHYYFRFEIEEFFKDAKWLQGLEHTRFQKIESVTTLLWFVLIGWWCFVYIYPLLPACLLTHTHDRISFVRQVFEYMQRYKNKLMLSALGVRV
jgi:hypothetical protein